MKKIIILFLIVMCLSFLVSCNKEKTPDGDFKLNQATDAPTTDAPTTDAPTTDTPTTDSAETDSTDTGTDASTTENGGNDTSEGGVWSKFY